MAALTDVLATIAALHPDDAVRITSAIDPGKISREELALLAGGTPHITAALVILLANFVQDRRLIGDELWAACERVFSSADGSQLRKLKKHVTVIARAVAADTLKRCPAVGHRVLFVMLRAIASDEASKYTATPLHAEYARMACHARAFHWAQGILDIPLLDVEDAGSSLVTVRDVLLYHYYGGVLWAGAGEWDKAVSMWRTCLTIPVASLSAIQVEAHRKLIIGSLIAKGTYDGLPKSMAPAMAKSLNTLTSTYTGLATAMNAPPAASSLSDYVAEHMPEFTAHGNYGMVQHVIAAATERKVKQLTSTFTAVPLAAVASSAGLPSADDAERIVFKMIARGDLAASIDGVRGVVRFHSDDKSKTVSPAELAAETDRLSRAIKTVSHTVDRIKKAEEAVLLSKQHMRRQVGGGERRGGMGFGGMGMGLGFGGGDGSGGGFGGGDVLDMVGGGGGGMDFGALGHSMHDDTDSDRESGR